MRDNHFPFVERDFKCYIRSDVDKFLVDVVLTNACLIYAPSQIALAAIIHAASKQGHNLDAYVTKVLFGNEEGQENLVNIIETVRSKFCSTRDWFVGIVIVVG